MATNEGLPSEVGQPCTVTSGPNAVLSDMHDEWQSGDRRYLSEGSMALLEPNRNTGPIAAIVSGE